MRQGYSPDKAFGPTEVGGLVHATVQCPIFDPRKEIGNFQLKDTGDQRIDQSVAPLRELDPFGDPGYVRVVNVLALDYYELSIDYLANDTGYNGFNWTQLLKIGEDIVKSQTSVGSFIERVTVRVRLAAGVEMGWDKSAKIYVMQVTTPAFGQIIQDESIAYPIHPPAHTKASKSNLEKVFRDIDGKAKQFDERSEHNASR